jgi:ornithine cyclodeaminase/alanine dehydrogenase-like protein (mu-crystallin family)
VAGAEDQDLGAGRGLGGRRLGECRQRGREAVLTVCDLTGVGVQNVAAANAALANAAADAGERFET